MKAIATVALAASLVVGAVAQPHAHQHRHVKKHAGAEIEKRAPEVVIVYKTGPTVTVYQLGGEEISEEEAKKGLDSGVYVVIGETTPTYSSSLAPSSTSTTASSSTSQGGQFYESKVESSSTATPTPSKAVTVATSNAGAAAGIDADFPSGKVPCTEFVSSYGAIFLDYLGMKGWSGIQRTPNYKKGDASISFIETGITGDGCTPGSFCSYACPVGYQKTQWPAAQGSTLQSIGGLFCNANGMLELTRPEHPKLCEQGAGGVWVQNDLDAEASVCRTDYPGTESMVIPLVSKPGAKYPLTNPFSPAYYIWNNNPTTAQYYVNKKGIPVQDACLWNSKVDPGGAGNWAPVNIGVGKNSQGITFLSIFPNKPTTDALLDFNIEITGDISEKCQLINGAYTGGGNGCTVSDHVPYQTRHFQC
jgi:SUN family beta-glucosidase